MLRVSEKRLAKSCQEKKGERKRGKKKEKKKTGGKSMARRGKVHRCGPSLRPARVKVNESIEEVGQKCSTKWKRFERLFCQITLTNLRRP